MKSRTSANINRNFVDCRMIQLELDFFLLSDKQLKEFARYCALQVESVLGDDFFCNWQKNRNMKLKTLLEKIEKNQDDMLFFCDADVLSEVVYDQKSFNAYEKKLSTPIVIMNRLDRDVSRDYFDIFEQYLPCFNDQSRCKDAILKLFYEKGKVKRAYWKEHDSRMCFASRKYAERKNLNYGNFKFTMGLKCLNDINEYANKLIDIAVKATEISPNINARVAISPISSWQSCNAYRFYFNEEINDGSHIKEGFLEKEWYPYYYLQGVDWFNLLSPLITSRFHREEKDMKNNGNVILKTLSKGLITIQSTCEIEELDVYELREIREVLYPVLHPRKGKIVFKDLNNPTLWTTWAKPRLWWEHLPIFENEISVDTEAIHFKYQG